MEEYNINLNKQPLVIISTQGNVANGKTSIIKCLTKKSLMKFKKEAENIGPILSWTQLFWGCI